MNPQSRKTPSYASVTQITNFPKNDQAVIIDVIENAQIKECAQALGKMNKWTVKNVSPQEDYERLPERISVEYEDTNNWIVFMDNSYVYHRILKFKLGKTAAKKAKRYQTWLYNQLITNWPPNTVLVIDDAPYHNKLSVKPPNSNTPKPQMIRWLQKHNDLKKRKSEL
ncbi:unnamed protein product [Leptidea sinapis]|uniref:Uncharacterized protein n=1 Tax=Leptidea sinapis TaxID=189913 RepID=A0A5E4PVX2_9NEOP|nr:unnamed protein product [Leptidea sinapis]